MARKEKNKYLIQSVSLACSLLEQFRGDDRDLSVTELSRRLQVGKNNVFRLLATLEMRNFVEKNPATGAYRLGITSLKLGTACIRSKRLMQEARLPLEAVAKHSNETVILAVFREGGLVCEDVVESTLPVRVLAEIGTSLPLHCTAAGKVILAFGNEDELRPFAGSEPAATSMKALTGHLNSVREKGYAVSFEEYRPDVCSIAAPVRNHISRVIGVISVVGPSYRISPERLHGEIAPLVVRCASEISMRMGYHHPEKRVHAKHSGFDVSSGCADARLSGERTGQVDNMTVHGNFHGMPKLFIPILQDTVTVAA